MTTKQALDRGFIQGVAYAAAELARAFDQPSMAYHLLRCSGIDAAELRKQKVDAADAVPCRAIIRTEKR